MSKAARIALTLAMVVAGPLLVWLLGSFIAMDVNVSGWSVAGRFFLVTFSLVFDWVLASLLMEEIWG